MPLPYPHVFVPDVTHITPALLKKLGVAGLLLDIDGTLMETRDAMPARPVLDWLEEMKSAGVALYILSNNRHRDRVQAFAQAVDLPWQNLAGKPGKRGFCLAAERLGLPPGKLALVGDQIFTDTLGANRAGVTPLLIQPIRLAGNPGRYIRYAAETPFRLLGGRRPFL